MGSVKLQYSLECLGDSTSPKTHYTFTFSVFLLFAFCPAPEDQPEANGVETSPTDDTSSSSSSGSDEAEKASDPPSSTNLFFDAIGEQQNENNNNPSKINLRSL